MTIQGALNDLSNLINSSDIPMYYKPSLKKIKETIELEMQPKMGEWIFVHPLQEDDEGAYMCSCCGVGNWGIDPKVDKYCFNCGARMNGGGEE